MELAERLYQELLHISVIDTHEHLWYDETGIYKPDDDVLREYLIHYMRSDIVSAGIKADQLQMALDSNLPIAQRWRIVEPYWEWARYTGYGRALDLSVRAIYGIEGINARTIEPLNEAFLAQRTPGHYLRVMRELCNIEVSLLDMWTFEFPETNDLFRQIWQPQNFIAPSEPEGYDFIPEMERKHGVSIVSLDDWLGVFESELDDRLLRHNVRTLKTSIAYSRSLHFENVEYATAKQQFIGAIAAWRSRGGERAMPVFPAELQDFMVHHLLKLADARNLTIQWHTGLFDRNSAVLKNGDPSLLNNLFMQYPNVDFDLFHISYPFQAKAAALCKMFPNVYIDMCWAHIVSPAASRAALADFLDAIPYSKISAFGGDYLFADGIYGHLEISRRNVSAVLADKVRCGVFTEDKAIDIARALYCDNPKRIFKL